MHPLVVLIHLVAPQAIFRVVREIPLVWFLLGCLIAGAALFLARKDSPHAEDPVLRRIAFAAGVLVLGVFVVLSLYSLRCFMLQFDEANILAIAAAGIHGLPVYLPPRSPDADYSLMYGPYMFLIYRVALLAGGAEHFVILRCLLAGAGLGVCGALYALSRRFVSAGIAVALLAFPVSAMLQHIDVALGIRSDIWILLFATLAVLCSFLEIGLPALILTGIMCGVLIDLKISAAPAILFPLLTIYRKHGLRGPILSSSVAIAVALAPFALPTISLRNYIAWVLFARSEGVQAQALHQNVLFALFVLAPCFIGDFFSRRHGGNTRQRLPELAIIVLSVALALATSKPGSGPWYFWHILPSIVVYVCLATRDSRKIPAREHVLPVYLMAAGWTLFALINVPRCLQKLQEDEMSLGVQRAKQAVEQYVDVYRNRTIQMGYGADPNDARTRLRYLLVYKGEPYTIEGNTGRFETLLLPFPVNVLKHMETCKNDVWLLPHDEKPFQTFWFPESLRSTFSANYHVAKSGPVYDAWTCNHAKAQ